MQTQGAVPIFFVVGEKEYQMSEPAGVVVGPHLSPEDEAKLRQQWIARYGTHLRPVPITEHQIAERLIVEFWERLARLLGEARFAAQRDYYIREDCITLPVRINLKTLQIEALPGDFRLFDFFDTRTLEGPRET